MVDEEKLEKKGFIMLVKRSNKPITQKLVNQILNREFANKVKKMGIVITNSYYTHGNYDWVICFNANDIKDAKTFVEIYSELYEGHISEINLIEIMFTAVSSGVTNPEIEKLEDFFKI